MVISDYYSQVLKSTSERNEFRAVVMARTGMSYSTFYAKLSADKFKPAEKEVICTIIKERENA